MAMAIDHEPKLMCNIARYLQKLSKKLAHGHHHHQLRPVVGSWDLPQGWYETCQRQVTMH